MPVISSPASSATQLTWGGIQTAAFSATAGTTYVVNLGASLGAVPITLPSAPAQGTWVAFTRIDVNAASSFALVTPGGSDTLLAGSTYSVSAGTATFIYQGTQWSALSNGFMGYGGLLGPSVNAASAPNIMARDVAGRSQVTDPAVAADIATKNYVDGKSAPAADPLIVASCFR